MDWKAVLLSSSGRCRRQDFWIGVLILFGAGFVFGLIPLINIIAPLAMIYPWVCLYAQRLHDAGRTGWLAAVPWIIQIVAVAAIVILVLTSALGEADDMTWLFAAIAIGGGGVIAWLAFTLWVGLAPSDPHVNRYGAPPNGTDPAAVFA